MSCQALSSKIYVTNTDELASCDHQTVFPNYNWVAVLKSVVFIPLALERTEQSHVGAFYPCFFSIELMCIVFTNAGHFSLTCLWLYQR